jgi:hypothetical protein
MSDAQTVHALFGAPLRSVFNRAARRPIDYSRHSRKGWPAARYPDRSSALAGSGTYSRTKIAAVGPLARVRADAPRDVNVIDLGNATLVPGLIDCHAHLLSNVSVPTEALFIRYGRFGPGLLLTIAGMSPAERVLLGAQMAREDLESGFTTVRNLGHSGVDGDAALRDAGKTSSTMSTLLKWWLTPTVAFSHRRK